MDISCLHWINGFKYEFTNVKKNKNNLEANVKLSNIKRLMAIVAHPDDEILGLGGTIHKIKSETNCQIKLLFWERVLL